jgi:polar amino acid transport system permease protein
MLLVAVIWYLFITSILNIGQSYIEAYYGRGERQSGAGPTPAVAGAAVEANH